MAAEVKALDKIMKGGLSRFFRPITNFFQNVRTSFSNVITKFKDTKIGRIIDSFIDSVKGLFRFGDVKGFGRLTLFEDLQKTFGRLTQPLLTIIEKGKTLFNSIRTGVTAGFAPIAKFAATLGRTLGKIFLPVTVLFTVIDFVKGFMAGYKADGIIGGITEGVVAAIDGLVGGLIRLVTKGCLLYTSDAADE